MCIEDTDLTIILNNKCNNYYYNNNNKEEIEEEDQLIGRRLRLLYLSQFHQGVPLSSG